MADAPRDVAHGVPTTQVGVGYRPHLDGIRTVAVYLGVAFHVGADRLKGGFIGVDIFFVLSGYLVTQLLIRDLSGKGSIELRRFYSRRIRRLLPAATMALFATAVVFSSLAAPAELQDGRNAVSAAALHVSNWFFIAQSVQYFGADLQSNPVVQFWSLSVEEQFYAAWPLLLATLYAVAGRFGARRWTIVQGTVLAIIAVSFTSALWIGRTNLDRAYYGTDTRVYQLLGGAMLALSPGILVRLNRSDRIRSLLPYTALAGLGGLLFLSTWIVDMPPIERGALAALCTLTLIASMEAGPHAFVRRFLSTAPMVYLGKISYGTYLWHWLVIVVSVRVADVSPFPTFLLSSFIATGLSALSYEVVERPFRESPRLTTRRRTVVVLGLGTSVAMGLLVAPFLFRQHMDEQPVDVVQGTSVGATRVPEDLDWRGAQQDSADFPTCTADTSADCTLVTGKGPHILLIGDSHARMYIPMLTALAKDLDLTFSADVAPACPWQEGLQYRRSQKECRDHQADMYPGVVDRLDPDVVVVANRSFDAPGSPLFVSDQELGELPPGSKAYLDSVRARTSATIKRFRDAGRRVVILEPVPVAPLGVDPVVCLSDATYLDECRFVSSVDPTPVERIYRDLAENDSEVWSLDLDRRACPYLPICDPIVDQLIVRRDASHLTTRFALTLLTPFEKFLTTNKVLP
ncbi:MAG: acyltransferase family protein [Microthrixaceae bacterium]